MAESTQVLLEARRLCFGDCVYFWDLLKLALWCRSLFTTEILSKTFKDLSFYYLDVCIIDSHTTTPTSTMYSYCPKVKYQINVVNWTTSSFGMHIKYVLGLDVKTFGVG